MDMARDKEGGVFTDSEKKKNSSRKRVKPRIVIIPHYVGTEKANDVLKDVLADEIKKKIDKPA